MGISTKDFRIFFNRHTKTYIICNDYKRRILLDMGYSEQQAKDKSHGHIRNIKDAEEIRDCILSQKRAKARDTYTLECILRVTDKDYRHYKWTEQLYNTKANKGSKKFIRINKGLVV